MPTPKKVVLLGSTGSVGTSTVKVAQQLPQQMQLLAIAGGSRVKELAEQALHTGVKHVGIFDKTKVSELAALLPSDVNIYAGEEGLIELSTLAEADMVLVSIVGTAGLKPALAAVQAGKQLAVASKEILVMAGEIIMREAQLHKVDILPVDSEHNAIFQCLAGGRPKSEISRLILTASGGPFRQLPSREFKNVTVESALQHPTWSMGQKISIDSATLFNKGLEMIEARWLFDIEMDRVEAIIHPQSIIHSMVEYIDGSVLAQLSNADMCFPIQYAITYPERVKGGLKPLDFTALSKLEFETPRYSDFPALDLAKQAGTAGGAIPAVLNAANEIAVDAFLNRKLNFTEIWSTVEAVMAKNCYGKGQTLEELINADDLARKYAIDIIGS